MVFSSHPLYDQLDPPDWQYHQHQQQQQMILYGVGNEISNSITTPQHPPLQQPPLAATSGSRNIRPGSMTDRARMAKVPLPETSLKCPRCESTNTKFCYFNNYSLTQPRHFCKTCRRYWTRGGALRNVPVGGGCRRSATKRSGKKRSKSPAISSGTATATTTTTSTDQNGNINNIIDDGVPQFPLLNPHGSLNQMMHEFDDHYIGGVNNNNNYGGSYTDPHIARLVQTGVISLTDSSTDHHHHQWNKLGVTTLTPFPFLTNFPQQEHYYSSQSYGLGYQLFNQCSGQLGLTESSQVEAPTMDDHQTIAAQVTNVKMENGERGLKRFLELRALERSHTSMASGNGQFSMVGNTWSDVIDFTSNDEQTTGQNSL